MGWLYWSNMAQGGQVTTQKGQHYSHPEWSIFATVPIVPCQFPHFWNYIFCVQKYPFSSFCTVSVGHSLEFWSGWAMPLCSMICPAIHQTLCGFRPVLGRALGQSLSLFFLPFCILPLSDWILHMLQSVPDIQTTWPFPNSTFANAPYSFSFKWKIRSIVSPSFCFGQSRDDLSLCHTSHQNIL